MRRDQTASPNQAETQSQAGASDGPNTPLGTSPPAGASNKPLGATNQNNSASTQPMGSLTDTGGGWFIETLTALGLVIGLILLARWAWVRLSGQVTSKAPAGSKAVEVLSRTAVAPRNHVLLLRVGQRILVVSDSSSGMQTLAQVDQPEEVAELLANVTSQRSGSISQGFRQVLTSASGEMREAELEAEQGRDHAEHAVDRTRDAVSSLLSRVRSAARGRGAA